MSAVPGVLFLGFLLHSALCEQFGVSLPGQIEVVRGSCLTIPCSFTIGDKYENNLHSGCVALWKTVDRDQTVEFTRATTGDLTLKNCTTTVHEITQQQQGPVFFRVECGPDNPLKWTFRPSVDIKVNEAPPTPTLTPPTLNVTEGESVSVQCSAPVPCLSLPPTLTWSPVLGDVQETLEQQQDETFVKVSTLSFTASDYKTALTCSAVYSREDGTTAPSVSATATVTCAQCDKFSVNLPQNIKAVQGSCLTIPCSFKILDKFKLDLNDKCKAEWRERSDKPLLNPRQTTGDLTQKNCTTTFQNIGPHHNKQYFFRVKCENDLKWTFKDTGVNIQVTEAPPTLTLTPPTLNVTEGESVSVQCSAPVPCLSLPPTLTWSPVLGDVQETLEQQQDETFVKVSTLSFTASHSQHEKNITCSAVYSKEDLSVSHVRAHVTPFVRYHPRNTTVIFVDPVRRHFNVTLKCSSDASPAVQLYRWYNTDGGKETLIRDSDVLNIKVLKNTAVFCEAQNDLGTDRSTVVQLNEQFSAQILSSSNCTGDWSQMSCLCEAEGNPSPLIQWYFPGVSATNISITSEALSDTSVRSVITVKDAQWRDPGTLLCHSSNSLGSDAQTFTVPAFQGRPTNTRVTVSPSGAVTEHSNVTLRCSSDASPAVQIYHWYKADGGTHSLIGNSSVLLMKASKDTTVIYCVAQNDHGTDNSTFTQLDVQYQPHNTTVTVNPSGPMEQSSNVTLTCSCDANPAVKHYRWYKTDTGFSTLIGHSAVLHIRVLKDTSSIFCETLNDLGTDRSAVTQLLVKYRPRNTRVTVIPQSSVTEHSNLTLKCSSEANPAVQIYHWYKADGGTFTLIGNSSVLLMKASKDTTVIYCVAQNDHGTDNSTFTQLDVQYQPHNTTVTVNPSGPMEQSSNVTLTCSCDANPAVKHYRWYKTDTGFSTLIGHSAVLHIRVLKDTSSIFCETLNDLGTDRSAVTQLRVKYRPRNTRVTVIPQSSVTEHSNLTLKCSSEANPAVQIYHWYKADGGTFTLIGNSSVLLMKASKDTAAIFCQTQNELGTDNSTFTQLDVQYSPRNTTILSHSFRPVAEHNNVTLKCSSDANPAVKHYRWYKTDGGSRTLMGDSSVLNFKASKDATRLYCEALNDLGTDRSTVTQLHVHYRPRNTGVAVSPRGSVTEHSIVTLKCRSDASPAVQNYSWYKSQRGNRTQIGNSAVLHIEATRHITAVFCEAQNTLGSDTSIVTHLDVQFPPQILRSSNCTGDAAGMSCTCDAEGSPVPTIQWYLSGISSNHSVSSEPLSGRALRSTINVTKLRATDPFSLVCHSSNSLGTDKRQLHTQVLPSEGVGAEVNIFILMAVVFILLVLVGVLLYIIRTKNVRLQKNQATDVALVQMPDSNELQEETDIYANANEVLSAAGQNIYANASEVKAEEPPQSGESDGNGGGGQADALYASINWKTKSKRKAREPGGDAQPSCSSYLEEQRSIVGDMGRCNVSEKLAECEYAQVKFKPRKAAQ